MAVTKNSAGILLYREQKKQLQFLLVHPGGPFWKNKQTGAWSIPKGEFDVDEDPLQAAIREFKEETGQSIKDKQFVTLKPIQQKSGKMVHAFATEGNFEGEIHSNNFKMEWPPRSGKMQTFPEVDKASWMNFAEASNLINPAQLSFLTELKSMLVKEDSQES